MALHEELPPGLGDGAVEGDFLNIHAQGRILGAVELDVADAFLGVNVNAAAFLRGDEAFGFQLAESDIHGVEAGAVAAHEGADGGEFFAGGLGERLVTQEGGDFFGGAHKKNIDTLCMVNFNYILIESMRLHTVPV
jgi:hypothetical protein